MSVLAVLSSLIISKNGLTPSLQSPTRASLAGKSSITIPVQRVSTYFVVKAKINGKDAKLIVDTGAGLNVLTPEASVRLGVAEGVKTTVVGVGEKRSQATIASTKTFELGKAKVENALVVITELPAVLKCDGLVGFSFLQNFATEFDYDRNLMIVHDPKKFVPSSDYSSADLQIVANHAHIPGTIGGKKGWFVVDTGNSGTITIYKWFSDQNELAKKWRSDSLRITGQGVGGFSMGRLALAEGINICDLSIAMSPVTLSDDSNGAFASRQEFANLGAEHLRRFNFVLDYVNKKTYFRKSKQFAQDYSIDRSGMRLDYVEGQLKVVEVLKDSVAEFAGLQNGDLVVAVDGRKVNTVHPLTAREPFRQSAGRKVDVTYQRGSETRQTSLILKEPISIK